MYTTLFDLNGLEINLAKGLIFVKLSLANGTTLNMLAADPYPKSSQEPPVTRLLRRWS